MKKNKNILPVFLIEEIISINQSLVLSEKCENWGYKKLLMAIRKLAMDEMFLTEQISYDPSHYFDREELQSTQIEQAIMKNFHNNQLN